MSRYPVMPLHVCLDARLIPGSAGGVEQATTGLMHALGGSGPGFRYSFLVYAGCEPHFAPYATGASELVPAGPPPLHHRMPGWLSTIKPWAKRTLRRLGLFSGGLGPEPAVVAALAPDLVHFPMQQAWRTVRRNLYQPWDLQHRHLPQFFTAAECADRDRLYRACCTQATRVVVASEWGRRDLAAAYGLDPARIGVVPMAAPTDAYPRLDDTEAKRELAALGVEPPYAYYPAQSWPHKNHLGLVRALARIRAEGGPAIRLVCSGRRTGEFAASEAEAARLDVALRHVGFVDTRRMVALYRGARLLVFPSLFEGWGLPITEAMSLGVPIAAARSTCIPEQLGDAGVLFDPADPADIARAVCALWEDATLRERCVAAGRARVARYTWAATAAAYNRIYQELART